MSAMEMPQAPVQPAPRQSSVLVYDASTKSFMILAHTVTVEEQAILGFPRPPAWENGIVIWKQRFCEIVVQKALLLEFKFRTEADRARWKNGEDFEMYRDARA